MSNDSKLKELICDALDTWVGKRPKFGDEHVSASERREVSRDMRDALKLSAVVRARRSITAVDLQEAFKQAFGGRLECHINEGFTHTGRVTLEYTPGQYGPVEYRAAAAAVLAHALRYNVIQRDMPRATYKPAKPPNVYKQELRDGLSPGAWVRRYFRREFGSAFQRRWFN